MRYGYWLPVFGGWLRNVEDESMEASWPYVSRSDPHTTAGVSRNTVRARLMKSVTRSGVFIRTSRFAEKTS